MIKGSTFYDEHLFPNGSPITQGSISPSVVPWQNWVKNKIQIKQGKFSRINIKQLIFLSNNSSGTYQFTGTAQTISIVSTLTPNIPHQMDVNFAVPYIALYEGTTNVNNAGSQIFPGIGANQVSGRWHAYGGLDWHQYDGTISAYSMTLENVSAGSVPIFFVTQWKWLFYNSGAVT